MCIYIQQKYVARMSIEQTYPSIWVTQAAPLAKATILADCEYYDAACHPSQTTRGDLIIAAMENGHRNTGFPIKNGDVLGRWP